MLYHSCAKFPAHLVWQIYLGQIVSEKLPLELPWTKLAVGESKSRCMRVGTMGANVLMCGRWLGRDNERISQSPGWLIWDGSSEPLTMGSPIVLVLIPTSHKLQTKVNLFLKGGKISTRVSARESDSKTYLWEMTDSQLWFHFLPYPLLKGGGPHYG